MREILFRGKRKDDGDWEEGSLVVFTDYDTGLKEYWITNPGQTVDFVDNRQYEVIPDTVGQYTGVKDIHGRKIFEGDIVRCSIVYDVGQYPCTETEIHPVKYTTDGFYPLYRAEQKNLEVLGNIHDNPELLEERK